MNKLILQVGYWAIEKGLIKPENIKSQTLKVVEEVGELCGSILKQKDPKDDIGDILVTLIILSNQLNLTLEECLQHAYDEIKDRQGELVDGSFIKN